MNSSTVAETTVHCQWVKWNMRRVEKKMKRRNHSTHTSSSSNRSGAAIKEENREKKHTLSELNGESSWDKKRMRRSFSRFHNLLALFQLYANGQMCKCRKRLRNKNATFTNNLAAKNSCASNSLLKWYQWFSSPFSPKKAHTHSTIFARSLARSFIP